ncbi:MAG: hypothetical protein WC133_01220 [Candidatus Omnitrophota bacterium]
MNQGCGECQPALSLMESVLWGTEPSFHQLRELSRDDSCPSSEVERASEDRLAGAI